MTDSNKQELHEYVCKVKAVGMSSIGKHPLHDHKMLNKDELERLIASVTEIMKITDEELQLKFNNICMDFLIDDTIDYSSLRHFNPKKYEKHDEVYDDDLTYKYLYKDL
jgi:hypothetical protein